MFLPSFLVHSHSDVKLRGKKKKKARDSDSLSEGVELAATDSVEISGVVDVAGKTHTHTQTKPIAVLF